MGDSANIFWTLLECLPHPLKPPKTALGIPTYRPYTHMEANVAWREVKPSQKGLFEVCFPDFINLGLDPIGSTNRKSVWR